MENEPKQSDHIALEDANIQAQRSRSRIADLLVRTKTGKVHLKNLFVVAIVGALVLSAIIGIIVILKGSFDATDGRILLTTLVAGIFSVTSLANLRSSSSGKDAFRYFSWLSIFLSITAVVLVVVLIWQTNLSGASWKPAMIFSILAIATAHISLLLPLEEKKQATRSLVFTTVGFIAIVAAMLIYLVVSGANDSDFYFRVLGVFAILDVLGTIISPVVAKLTR